MNENKNEWICGKCNQEVPLVGTNQYSGGNRTIIEIKLGKESSKKVYFCLSCWEQEKDKFLPKMREKECFVVKNVFSKYKDIEGSNSAWAGTESYYPGMFCLVCQRFVFKDEAVSDGHGNLSLIEKKNCSANCQRKYDNLSFEEKESLRKNISNPSSKSSMTTEERERERERERANQTIPPKKQYPLHHSPNQWRIINWVSEPRN